MDAVSIYRVILPILFAVLALPLIIRFIIGRLVFRQIHKKHIEKLRSDFPENRKDDEAFDAFNQFLKGKINTPFLSSNKIREDLKTILIIVQNAYSGEKGEDLKLSFSVSDLIKSFFLLMNDLNVFWKKNSRMDRFARTRVSTFLRINRVNGYYSLIYKKIPFLKILRKGRITGKMIRILFIPLIGLPSIIVSVAASLISLFLTEIIWRHYYSVFLIRCFYYILILYGDRSSILRKRLENFSMEKIKREAGKAEELIDPENHLYRSGLFEEAYLIYQQYLEKYEISPEKDLDFNGIAFRFNKKRDFAKRIFQIPLRAAGQFNPVPSKTSKIPDRENLLEMIQAIAYPYNQKEIFYSNLRLVDLFDSLYMISLLAYNRILYSSILLDNVSVDFLLTAKNISDEISEEWLKGIFPRLKQTYRSYKLYRKGRVLYKALRRGNAVGLFLSVSGPLAIESMRTIIRDYIFRRSGRMVLYCYECNKLKKKRLFSIDVFEDNEILP